MSQNPNKPLVALVVDDEALIRMVAADLLAENGFMTYEAADGIEALAVLQSHPDIALLVTDINMPGAPDGLGLASEARRRRPDLHIVVTSGRISPSDEHLPSGSRFVAKPYTVDQLMKAVASSSGASLHPTN